MRIVTNLISDNYICDFFFPFYWYKSNFKRKKNENQLCKLFSVKNIFILISLTLFENSYI